MVTAKARRSPRDTSCPPPSTLSRSLTASPRGNKRTPPIITRAFVELWLTLRAKRLTPYPPPPPPLCSLDRLHDKAFRPLRKALGPVIEEQKTKFFEPPLPRVTATDEVSEAACSRLASQPAHANHPRACMLHA